MTKTDAVALALGVISNPTAEGHSERTLQLARALLGLQAECERLRECIPQPVFENGQSLEEVRDEGSYRHRGPMSGTDAPRYIVDHGTIHDLVTGKHVLVHQATALLNDIARVMPVYEAACAWRDEMNWNASRARAEIFTREVQLHEAVNRARSSEPKREEE